MENIRKLGILSSFAIYIPAGILMYLMTHFLIPYLSDITKQETILFWFIVGGLGVFLPLIILGLILLKNEGNTLNWQTVKDRLRFRKFTFKEFLWMLGGLVAVGALSGIMMTLLKWIIGDFDHSPAFMQFEPLTDGRYWLLAVWAPYWILNILGEEFIWRGVMLPRQEAAFGKKAWIIHSIGWLIFHIAFGWQLLIMLLPIVFILPYIAQKTQNSWAGVIIHGGLNGPSFIAICFGLI